MILRLSQKLAKKVKASPSAKLPPDPVPFADWSAHLFTVQRAQYLIMTNTPSLYSVIMHGRGISSTARLVDHGLDCIREAMIDDGLAFFHAQFVAPATATVRFATALNRSVTGSMNDLIFHAKCWLIEGELSPFGAAGKLNEIPMSALGYRNPREALKSLAAPADAAELQSLNGRYPEPMADGPLP